MKFFFTTIVAAFILFASTVSAQSQLTAVPKQFQASSPDSKYSIKYDDVNQLLKKTVVNTGRSSRERAAPNRATTGTRMKKSIKRSTVNEGNRFYFEVFQGDDEAKVVLNSIKNNLQLVPDQVELAAFSRNEQLAYWLNLYNVTMLDALVNIYPENKLNRVIGGKNSILDDKILKVAGVDLSLNDIKFILRENYNGDPLVIYGLYQGIVGGPNIRKVAYTGPIVYNALEDNAEEFINSNRGTESKDSKTFRVSSLYERDEAFFPTDDVLKKHLLRYLQSPELEELQAASKIKRDIDDWTITDLYGSSRDPGGSLATNAAALLDSSTSTQPGQNAGESVTTNFSAASSSLVAKAARDTRYSTDLLVRLQEIDARRELTAKGGGVVTIEELGAVEVPPAESDKDDNQ
jgi:hypothetical protein